ncbi:MAG: S1C family serine protease [Alphaproteobacteria bacterium]
MRSNLLLRVVILWALILATVWVLEPYVVSLWAAATEPRTITPRGSLAEYEETTVKLFKAASPSVVHVFAAQPGRGIFQLEPVESAVQSGSGIVWDAAGHVITNYHVIRGADRIRVRLSAGDFAEADIVGAAPNYDLAVLRLDRPRALLHPIAIGSSADLQVGQAAFAIGNPYGLEQTLTSGIISAVGRRLPTSAAYEIGGVIQTDAAVNPGNSGGPLLDSAGRLIGVNSAIISRSGASAGIGFAIPVDTVNRIAADLIRQGRVPIAGIGIVAARESTATQLGIDGIIIIRVLPDSPAAQAGLVSAANAGGAIGDVILAANGTRVHNVAELAAILQQIGIGNTVRLTILRNSQVRDIEIAVADVSVLQQ